MSSVCTPIQQSEELMTSIMCMPSQNHRLTETPGDSDSECTGGSKSFFGAQCLLNGECRNAGLEWTGLEHWNDLRVPSIAVKSRLREAGRIPVNATSLRTSAHS